MPEFKSEEVFDRIVSCMNELADAKGVSRCGLMYALAQLIETLQQGVTANEQFYLKKIAELEKKIKEYETPTEAEE